MKKKFFSVTGVYKKVKGGYTAWVEEMPGVITQGKNLKDAEENLKDALSLMVETNRLMAMKDAIGDIERRTVTITT